MTNKSGNKKEARDIQKRTGWPYAHVKFIVDQLGYEVVSRAVDDAPEGTYESLRDDLGTRAQDLQKVGRKGRKAAP